MHSSMDGTCMNRRYPKSRRIMKIQPRNWWRKYRRTGKRSKVSESSCGRDSNYEWLFKSYSRQVIPIDDHVSVSVKATTTAVFKRDIKKKTETPRFGGCVKKQQAKKPLITKGTSCCGVYHNNDLKYLNHYLRAHCKNDNQVPEVPDCRRRRKVVKEPELLDSTCEDRRETSIEQTYQSPSASLCNENPPLTAKLLLCCGDVETNPGPTFNCLHNMCCPAGTVSFDSLHGLSRHITTQHVFDVICGWDGCVWGPTDVSDREMETHILKHIYMTTIFELFDSWCKSLPSGCVDWSTTDLRLCPPTLRCNFNELLLDDEFAIQKRYTLFDHSMYLYHLERDHPTEFYRKVEDFISRQPPGKLEFNSKKYTITDHQYKERCESLKVRSHGTPRSVYCVKQPHNTDTNFIYTSRPELLGSRLVHFTMHDMKRAKKRKLGHEIEATINSPLQDILLNNLESCRNAIDYEFKILHHLEDTLFISQKNKFLLDAEDCAVRLATSPGTSAGIFVCNIFQVEVDGKNIYYARYLESGCYHGFMDQIGKNYLTDFLNISHDCLLLSQVVTNSDIEDLVRKKENTWELRGTKGRTDKNYKNNVKAFKRILADSLSHASNCNVNFVFNLSHFVRKGFQGCIDFKLSDDWFLHTNIDSANKEMWQKSFQSFPLDKLLGSMKTSETFCDEIFPSDSTLLGQSVYLNQLSNSHLLMEEKTRFFERLPTSTSVPKAFRYKIFWLFLRNEKNKLIKVFESCKTSADVLLQDFDASDLMKRNIDTTVPKLQTRKSCNATKESITRNFGTIPLENLANMCTISDCYIRDVTQSGSLFFHTNTPDKITVVLNDYKTENGNFQNYEYVHTTRERTEDGFIFRCTCTIYRTILECVRGEDIFLNCLIDASSCIKCMHCRFLKDNVIPILENDNQGNTQLGVKVIEGLKYCDKTYIPLQGRSNTKKFSILKDSNDDPSFVHITFNTSTNKYVISCLNGYCKSHRGSKRNVELFNNSKTLCKHLKLIHETQEWQSFIPGENRQRHQSYIHGDDINQEDENDLESQEIEIDIGAELLHDTNESSTYFDEPSGLLKFPCKSSHAPKKEFSRELASAVQLRDLLNDNNSDCVPRVEGCLQGPCLVQPIPSVVCSCGSGWISSSFPEGRTAYNRRLHIYTEIAPVVCEVHTHICVASTCTLEWDEGANLCIHVYSSDTAAGDEIGWMFVNQVLHSRITFSGFCKTMTSTYKRRCPVSRGFMDPGVFLKWWFSWASNMKIDFRKPCEICKFRPKQLACDGTKIGIAFKNAVFEPIEKSHDAEPNLHGTLHRRFDRCFITKHDNVLTESLKVCREHLFYLGSTVNGDRQCLDHDLSEDEIMARTESLFDLLPQEAVPSFRRFLIGMPELEKQAYGMLLILLSTTAPLSTIIPSDIIPLLRDLLENINEVNQSENGDRFFNAAMQNLRFYCPEIRNLIANSMSCNFNDNMENILPQDIISLIRYIMNRVDLLDYYPAEEAVGQIGTYNPPKYGRAYYFSPSGCAVRKIRKFTIDDCKTPPNTVSDDNPMSFETCNKLFAKTQISARGSTSLFLWFCPSHGHCYGFHMAYAEGRKDPFASLYTHLEIPPEDIFYDFGCNLQEYCLNRESGYFKNVRFFHDIFHGYSHKCSKAYRSTRLLGFDTVNSEICEQFNSFLQNIKPSARQMNQTHFCFYLQFFLHIWNEQKYERYKKKSFSHFGRLKLSILIYDSILYLQIYKSWFISSFVAQCIS